MWLLLSVLTIWFLSFLCTNDPTYIYQVVTDMRTKYIALTHTTTYSVFVELLLIADSDTNHRIQPRKYDFVSSVSYTHT